MEKDGLKASKPVEEKTTQFHTNGFGSQSFTLLPFRSEANGATLKGCPRQCPCHVLFLETQLVFSGVISLIGFFWTPSLLASLG